MELLKISRLQQVTHPLVRIRPLPGESLPEFWHQGDTIYCRLLLLGLIPLGTRTIFIEQADSLNYLIQSREFDPLIKRWDHRITLQSFGENGVLYTDEVEINAGLLTLPVWLFAYAFYRQRQQNWHNILQELPVDVAT